NARVSVLRWAGIRGSGRSHSEPGRPMIAEASGRDAVTASAERSVIREHVPPDADGDDDDDQAERKPELIAREPAADGGAELGARDGAGGDDQGRLVRDLPGDQLADDARDGRDGRDRERAADRHADRHAHDDDQQRDEEKGAAGPDEPRAHADASTHRSRAAPAEAPRLADGYVGHQ